MFSRTFLLNSGSSSRKSTPWWLKETSPGRGYDPPPIRPASEIVWCGERKGLVASRGVLGSSTPATEWILVVSSASSRERSGRIRGKTAGEHGLAGPGRADHHDVVAARRRDQERALDVLLPFDIMKIDGILPRLVE